jgi:hypothetical protein
MNFFCTKKHYDEWVAAMKLDPADIFCLDAREALAVARMIFSV